ncbi:ubiquitin recognition factor in ER-associated degradation protein 1 isoform X1 [Moschus berezovskii]|uniref:ubiquitin recognition factor in ER-associated degradation protein 1 isoform X1 n=1 Tax=Moschus berezovskii TaxID=68408 RepID=UPI0024438F96|nr:ubiquitin recognition factor in ER-associated degradation protein 1 isoform X1 [Moschus berezovskii]
MTAAPGHPGVGPCEPGRGRDSRQVRAPRLPRGPANRDPGPRLSASLIGPRRERHFRSAVATGLPRPARRGASSAGCSAASRAGPCDSASPDALLSVHFRGKNAHAPTPTGISSSPSTCSTTRFPGSSRTASPRSTAASLCPCLRGLMTVIMPPSALDQLSRLNITYPMLFKLTNKNSDRVTHCGVLEFVADEGICYLPHWMMQNLLLEEGGLVQVESVNLQVATYSKFQPQSPDFLDITNPKAVLENALRNFACLTTGDVIAINYNEKIYELRVMETKPDKAVSIIECDMNVDFDAPLGYKEPERQAQHEDSAEGEADHSGYTGELGFRAFSGSGNRLDGKKKGVEPSPSPVRPGDIKRGIPNYEFKLGKITFIRNSRPLVKKVEEDEAGGRFVAFSGEGQSLRKKGRKP